MTESDAYLQLALYLGVLLSLPFFWSVGRAFGRFIVYKFFPPKFITIKIKRLDNSIEKRKVEIDDVDALVKALLEGEPV